MPSANKKHIIGNGLIAGCLKSAEFNKKTLFLASGVSNSKEVREAEFQRESELITSSIQRYPDCHVVYFSTCSLEGGGGSPYTEHKLQMESLIQNLSSNFNILRLPQVVGLVWNSTLISFFVNSIWGASIVNVEKYATRNLLDVQDVSRIVQQLINTESGINSVQNIASGKSVSVVDIVEKIANLLNREAKINLTPTGSHLQVSVDFLSQVLKPNDPLFADDYWIQVLNKYIPKYIKQIESRSLQSGI